MVWTLSYDCPDSGSPGEEYEGKAKIGKLDVDSAQKIAAEFGIRSIPTLLLFKDGKVADQIIGTVPKQQITDKLDAIIGG